MASPPLGTTSFSVKRGEMTLVLKRVPARVCNQCGEPYFDEDTTRRIEQREQYEFLGRGNRRSTRGMDGRGEE
jgi:YgiT-type zinc finger domain-containing protein